MNPAPTQELLDDFYNESENYRVWHEIVYPATKESRWETLHRKRSAQIRSAIQEYGQFTSPTISYLEFGAGTGDTASRFIFDSAAESVKAMAIEANPLMRSSLREKGIGIIELQELSNFQDHFHVAAAFEVLEHILNPLDLFHAASRCLVRGGLFVFSTPNAQSLEVQILRGKSSTIDREHISILTPAAVAMLANSSGLIVRSISANGQLDLELLVQAGVLPSETAIQDLIGWGSQDEISGANFSSNQFVILQKPH